MEQTLESIIMDNLSLVQQRGFPDFYSNTIRQLRLPTGKVCDVFSYHIIDNEFNFKLFELKKGYLGVSSLFQVLGYCKTIIEHVHSIFEKINAEVFLVGQDVSSEIFDLFSWGINVTIVTFDYKIDGIHFETWQSPGAFPNSYWQSAPTDFFTVKPEQSKFFIENLKNKSK